MSEEIAIIEQAKGVTIATQQDYNNAAEVCKDIKARIKDIETYWKDLKDKSYKAWKDVCAKEKELLEPFTKAEADIKAKMTTFQREKMEEERIQREEAEKRKREEAEFLLQEAAKADADGNAERSDFMLEAAENAQNMKIELPKQEKTAGTAVKKIWKARVINEVIVPAYANGMCIRKIDEAMLNKLAGLVKGKSDIQGVEFFEDVQIAISRG